MFSVKTTSSTLGDKNMKIFYINTDEKNRGFKKNHHDEWIKRAIAVTSGYENNQQQLAKPTTHDLMAMCLSGTGIVAFGTPCDDSVSRVTDRANMVNSSESFEFHRRVEWFLDVRMDPITSPKLRSLGCPVPSPKPSVREIQKGQEALCAEMRRHLSKTTSDEAEYARRSGAIIRVGLTSRPKGVLNPERVETTVSSFVRDPAVRAWVMQRSGGCCEQCNLPAPFQTPAEIPYLECHHIQPLSLKGADTVYNTAALCPNCHREQHSGSYAKQKQISLAEAVQIKESALAES
jgi:5-methylcytosine-specific restriction endonuclease McrA